MPAITRLLFLLLLAACCAAARAADDAPLAFRLEEDSYFPGWGSLVELHGGTLVCNDLIVSTAEKHMVKFRMWKATPTPAQWKEFRRALDAIGVWNWHGQYVDRDISDGGGWSLEIKYPGRSVKSAGINGYPDAGGKMQTTGFGDETATYKRFAAAVRKLTGTPPFKWGADDDAMIASPLPLISFTKTPCRLTLEFLATKGTEYFKDYTQHKNTKLVFVYRYNPRTPRPLVNYKRTSISLATALNDVLQMEGLDYEILGPHKIAIVDRKPDKDSLK